MARPDPARIQRIALINFGGIGDEILFAPVLSEIKKHLPHAQLTLILEKRSQSVVELLPGVAETFALDIQGRSRAQMFREVVGYLRRGRFDAVISSGSNPLIPVMLLASGIKIRVGFQTGALSRLLLSAEGPLDRKTYAARMYFSLATAFLGWLLGAAYRPTDAVLPELRPLPEEDRAWARQMLSVANQRPKVLLHPGVSLISIQKNILKGWPAPAWAELIRQLGQDGQVFLCGGPDDEATVREILAQLGEDPPHFTNLYGQTRNLRQLAALIAEADLLLCVDSSPMHIGVGYQRPLVAMFGPTDEKKLLPAEPRFAAIARNELDCRPCLWDVRQVSCEKPVCLDVEVDAMAAASRRLLGAPSAR